MIILKILMMVMKMTEEEEEKVEQNKKLTKDLNVFVTIFEEKEEESK